jgi:hypothetical protein
MHERKLETVVIGMMAEEHVNRSDILQLIRRRADIDDQITALGGILTSVIYIKYNNSFNNKWIKMIQQNKIGMTEPLVDNEGYPRADVDVYQVRHARHKIICMHVINKMPKIFLVN